MESQREETIHVLDAGTFGIICKEDYIKELDRITFLARLFSKKGFGPGDRIYLLRSQKLKTLQGTDPALEAVTLKKRKKKEAPEAPASSKSEKNESTVILATSRQVEYFLAEGIDDFEDVPLEEAVRTWRI
ncbi:MAG: hypothetical protein MR488_10880 [Lachnospiraceae bacterium]|nr:hypothetical protein [Lachnospiraceae bacterium]